jgi:hypothetical protein
LQNLFGLLDVFGGVDVVKTLQVRVNRPDNRFGYTPDAMAFENALNLVMSQRKRLFDSGQAGSGIHGAEWLKAIPGFGHDRIEAVVHTFQNQFDQVCLNKGHITGRKKTIGG